MPTMMPLASVDRLSVVIAALAAISTAVMTTLAAAVRCSALRKYGLTSGLIPIGAKNTIATVMSLRHGCVNWNVVTFKTAKTPATSKSTSATAVGMLSL